MEVEHIQGSCGTAGSGRGVFIPWLKEYEYSLIARTRSVLIKNFLGLAKSVSASLTGL